MKINDLMRLVAANYDDGFTDTYWDYGMEVPVEASGDTLAQFIVREIYETFDPEASDYDQLEEAYRVICSAKRQLRDLCDALTAAQERLP